jgi:DNA-binding IclR family transcriptional regulator
MDSVSGIGVLDKAMALLDAVTETPASLADLQTRTGLPRATAHRLATALETHGWLRRDPSGRYALGPELVVLGRAAAARRPWIDRARGVLVDLARTTGESVQFFEAEGAHHRRCLISVQSDHGLRWIVPEGALLPIAVGSAGHVLSGGVSDRRGWIDSVEEREVGVASVSAGVRDPGGQICGAVSVSGPLERLTRRPGQRFGEAVVAAARALEEIIASP